MNIRLNEYWEILGKYFKPQWRRVVVLSVLLFGSIGLQLYIPQIIREFIDAVSTGGTLETLSRLAVTFLVIAVVKELATAATSYVGQDVRWRATNALRKDLAFHTLNLDLGFHNQRTPGEMIERIDGDVNELSNFLSQFAIQIVGNLILLVGVLALLFREDWRVGLALTLFVILTMYVLSLMRSFAVSQWALAREASAEMFGFLEERLAGLEDIAGLGAGKYIMRRLHQAMYKFMTQIRGAYVKGVGLWVVSIVIFTVGNITAFAMGALLFNRTLITIGTVYLIFHYTETLRRPLEQITRQLQDLQKAGGSISRIRELNQMVSKIQNTSDVPLDLGALELAFDHMTFGYADDNEIVLDDVDFTLGKGQVMGLLGRTGSGKTTMARLIFRLYEVNEGAIRLSGVNLNDTHIQTLRNRVGMVTQEVQLFRATVRDNLTFFDTSIPDEEIIAVLKDLELYEWVQSLPEGLDTELESAGGGLSAGEAQLLAFTRVFLHDPGLVILDEASSRLDPVTEQLIERAVDKLLQDRTAIIIAHRLKTVQRANQIMIIERGKILEFGDRAGLAADPGSHFAQLMVTGLEEVLA